MNLIHQSDARRAVLSQHPTARREFRHLPHTQGARVAVDQFRIVAAGDGGPVALSAWLDSEAAAWAGAASGHGQ